MVISLKFVIRPFLNKEFKSAFHQPCVRTNNKDGRLRRNFQNLNILYALYGYIRLHRDLGLFIRHHIFPTRRIQGFFGVSWGNPGPVTIVKVDHLPAIPEPAVVQVQAGATNWEFLFGSFTTCFYIFADFFELLKTYLIQWNDLFEEFLSHPFVGSYELFWAILGLRAKFFSFLADGPWGLWFILLILLYVSAQASYQRYLNLGKGGTPPNWWGWWRIKRLMFFGKLWNVLDPPNVKPDQEPYRGLLWDLPRREGERPTVKGCAPQRQVNYKTRSATFDLHIAHQIALAKAHPEVVKTETSFLESHTQALFALPSAYTEHKSRPTIKQFGYEIAHPHRIDGSLHMILHPEDVRTVIEAGWGERHPLANTRWYWLFYFNHIK